MATALPFQSTPHEALRDGLATSLKASAALKHPVQAIQEENQATSGTSQFTMLRNLYGIAAPARVQIETQILNRFQRLPGLPSSKLGLEALTGELDEFRFESYLGLPEVCEDPPVDLHSQMEKKIGIAAGTKPLGRGLA